MWKTKQHNPTCPICRAEIVTTCPNQALDGCIEKFIDQFYPEAAKANRTKLLSERTAKKEAREKAKKAREQAAEGRRNDQHMLIGGILSANTRRRIDRVLSSDDSDNSWDTTFARLGVSPSRFSISSAASTTSYNGSFAGHTPVQWSEDSSLSPPPMLGRGNTILLDWSDDDESDDASYNPRENATVNVSSEDNEQSEDEDSTTATSSANSETPDDNSDENVHNIEDLESSDDDDDLRVGEATFSDDDSD